MNNKQHYHKYFIGNENALQPLSIPGPDICRFSLPDAEKAALPIVAVTANAFDEDRQNAAKAGMNGHLSKPFDMQQLLAMIENILP